MDTKQFLLALTLYGYTQFACNHVIAQQPLNYWRNSEAMIQEQASLVFEQACKVLANNPPSASVNEVNL